MSKDSRKLEIEAKLLVASESELCAIGALSRLGPFIVRPRENARLHSVYLDTSVFTLLRKGIALRLRRKGRRWEVTIKWAGKKKGVVHERMEETMPLDKAPSIPFRLPPGPIRERLSPLVGRRSLRSILVTDIRRQILDIYPPRSEGGNMPTVELALDRVSLKHPAETRSRATYREVEIELVAGTREDLAILVHELQKHADLSPSIHSKFSRGMALLYSDLEVRRKIPS